MSAAELESHNEYGIIDEDPDDVSVDMDTDDSETEEEANMRYVTTTSPILSLSHSTPDSLITTSELDAHCPIERQHDELLMYTHFDTSGYTSNNSSKDEIDLEIEPAYPTEAAGCNSISPLSSASASAWTETGTEPATTTSALHAKFKASTLTPYRPSPALSQDQDRHQGAPDQTMLQYGETPIEREIRLVREREEELLRSRTSKLSTIKEGKTTVAKCEKQLEPPKKPEPLSLLPYNDTQRKLATSRLQQEIEEQKRREMELRRDGRVRSISEEHTSCQHVNDNLHLGHDRHSPDVSQLVLDPIVLPKVSIRQQMAFFEQTNHTPALSDGHKRNAETTSKRPNVVPTTATHGGNELSVRKGDSDKLSNGIKEGEPLSNKKRWDSTPSLLTTTSLTTPFSSLSSNLTSPTTRPNHPFKPPTPLSSNMKVPMSIERLINGGKGRNGNGSPRPTSAIFSDTFSRGDDGYIDYSAVRTRLPVESIINVKKVYRSTEKKISEELEEMQNRETELRKTRKDLGLSVADEEVSSTSHDSDTNSQTTSMDRNDPVEKRSQRRTPLVAQWEGRIQQQQQQQQ